MEKSHDYHTSAHVPREDYNTIMRSGFYIYSENIKREKWKVMDETVHKIAEDLKGSDISRIYHELCQEMEKDL